MGDEQIKAANHPNNLTTFLANLSSPPSTLVRRWALHNDRIFDKGL